MVETEAERVPAGPGHEGGGAPVAPGAFSALLKELADVTAEPRAVSLPQPGAVIGRFELVRQIGGGGFGVVYEARDRTLGRSVAFKLVRPGRFSAGEDILDREAEVIAHLSHPNLVTLFDVGRSEAGPYLVLELLRGETLHERLRRGTLGPAETLRIAVEIAKGLAHAHGRAVVHRDLKPSNVFLCEDGGVKLLDFGMSHAFGRGRVSGGTPSYMAPEQLRGAPEDERTDVYALGVMLFQMIAGALPFPGDPRKEPARRRREAPGLEVAGAPALGALVARMLAEDPTGRPRDAREVLAALSGIAVAPRPADAPGSQGAARVRPRGRRRAARRVAGAAAAVAVVIAGALLARSLVAPPPTPRAIIVLPFVNLSESAENEYFSDGLTEEVLHLLTRLRELRVAARSSSFYFKGKKVQAPELAQRLGVDVVLEGSVRRDGGRLRVATELIDARSGFNLWAQTYDRTVDDVFAIQEDIARHVVGTLELVLSRASEGELKRPRAAAVAAYDAYLRGRAQLRLPPSAEALGRATAAFEEAAAADPAFAPAYAGLCEASLERYKLTRDGDGYRRAEGECARALSRDGDAGEVWLALGNLHLAAGKLDDAEREFRDAARRAGHAVDALLGLAVTLEAQRRTAEAERTFEEAARRDPGYWRLHELRGRFHAQAGRYAEAARAYRAEIAVIPDSPRAHNLLGAAHFAAGELEGALAAWRASLALAPTPVAHSNVGTSEFFLGRYAAAAATYERAIALAPDDHRLRGNLGDALARVPGREAEARAAYEKAVALAAQRLGVNAADARARADLAYYRASLGAAAEARSVAEEALRAAPDDPQVRYTAALVHARLGDPDAALASLERAVALGQARSLLPLDPGLQPIREHPRFRALVAPAPR